MTIKDIARKCGVGVGTVSRVLNGGKNVKQETINKVMKVVTEENYHPNKAARLLGKGNLRAATLGVVVPNFIIPFYYNIIKGVHQVLIQNGYNLIVFDLNKMAEKTYQHIADESLSGLLIIASDLNATGEKLLKSVNTKFVFVDYKKKNHNCFFYNNYLGGQIAARYLIENGCKRPAYIGLKYHSQQQSERIKGMKSITKKYKIAEPILYFIDISEDKAYQLTRKIVEEQKSDGIFFFCDELAVGGLKAVKELKAKCRIIGYDDLPQSKYIGLTSIQQNPIRMGYDAGEFLINEIKKPDLNHLQFQYEPVLNNRDS